MKLKFSKKPCRTSSHFIYCGKQQIGMVTKFATDDYQARTYFPDLQFHSGYETFEEAEAKVKQQFKQFLKGALTNE